MPDDHRRQDEGSGWGRAALGRASPGPSPILHGRISTTPLDATGTRVGGEVQVNTTTYSDQFWLKTAALQDGGWVSTWASNLQDGSGWGVYQQRFAANGSRVGGEMLVNSFTQGDQGAASIIALKDGGWGVAWQSAGQDGSGTGVYARIYNADGSTRINEFRLSTITAGDQFMPLLAGLADGGFVAVWDCGVHANYDSHQIRAQRFDANGVKIGGEFRVDDAGDKLWVTMGVTSRADGGFQVTWQTVTLPGQNAGDVYTRIFSASQAAPEVIAHSANLQIGGTLSAASLVSPGHPQGEAFNDSGLYPKTQYEFVDNTAAPSSGYLTLDGAVWEAGRVLRISAAELDRVQWHAGAGIGVDDFSVRGFDGTVWSGWAQGAVRTLTADQTVVAGGGARQVNPVGQLADGTTFPSVAVFSDGSYVVTWSPLSDGAGSGVYARRFAADGTPLGDVFSVATTTTNNQYRSCVAFLPGGGFVVSWESNENGANYDIYQQRFTASGTKVDGSVRVNTTTANNQIYSSVTVLSDGSWVTGWWSDSQDGSGQGGLYQQHFAANGTRVGGEVQVNTTTYSDQFWLKTAALQDGGWVSTWASNLQDGSGWGVYQQRFASNGSRIGGETQVNAIVRNDQIYSDIATLKDGGWVVAWQSTEQNGNGIGVYARIYNADGSARASSIHLSTQIADDQFLPVITGLADGSFVAVWDSGKWSGYDSHEIRAQRFDANGTRIGDEFRVDNIDASLWVTMGVSARPDGGFQVSWSSLTTAKPLNAGNIYTRVFSASGVQMNAFTGTAGNDRIYGSTVSDTLTGGAGSDAFLFADSTRGTDTITDFQPGIDRIEVVGSAFGGLPTGQLDAGRFALNAPGDADDRLVFNTTTGALSYDPDGNGTMSVTTIALLNVRSLSATDIWVVPSA